MRWVGIRHGGDGPGAQWLQEKVGQSERGPVEVAKPDLPRRGASSPSWAGSVSVPLLSVPWPRGAAGRGWQLPQGGLCVCSPPSLLCPPLPPSAFPVPPSAAVMATGVSRATAEPPLIGSCQAGTMEAWAALRCSQVSRTRRMEWGAGSPQTPQSPCTHLGQAAGKARAGGHSSGWGCPCVFLVGTAAWLPSWQYWGRGTPGTQPSTQGHFKGPVMAACSVGKQLRAGPRGAESSMEMLLGRGCCGETALEGGTGREVGPQLHQWFVHT